MILWSKNTIMRPMETIFLLRSCSSDNRHVSLVYASNTRKVTKCIETFKGKRFNIIPEEILCIQRASRLYDWLQFSVGRDTANANKSGSRNYFLGCLLYFPWEPNSYLCPV